MELLFNLAKGSLKQWIVFAVVLLAVNFPGSVYAQEDQDPATDLPASVQSNTGAPSSGTLSQQPWSGGNTTPAPSTRVRTSDQALRPAGGATTLDIDPGPNPDVPFDSNMNIAFLIVGLVFAFVVYKKRFAVKTEPFTK